MNIHKILPQINEQPEFNNVPPLPRSGESKTTYAFHLTPVHPVDKGFYGIVIEHRVTYKNGGSQKIVGQVYYNYDNDGNKPTMRELFALASAARVIFQNLIHQSIDKDTPQLQPLVQKVHVESINAVITQAFPLN